MQISIEVWSLHRKKNQSGETVHYEVQIFDVLVGQIRYLNTFKIFRALHPTELMRSRE